HGRRRTTPPQAEPDAPGRGGRGAGLRPAGAAAGPGASGPFLDRHVDEVPPLGPRAVVVADAVVAEQLAEHEPRVRGALADAAVRDRLPVGRDPLGAVEVA